MKNGDEVLHEVALVHGRRFYSDYDSEVLIQAIGEWESVTNEELQLLHKAVDRMNSSAEDEYTWAIIRKPVKSIVRHTIASAIAFERAEELLREQKRRERAESALVKTTRRKNEWIAMIRGSVTLTDEELLEMSEAKLRALAGAIGTAKVRK